MKFASNRDGIPDLLISMFLWSRSCRSFYFRIQKSSLLWFFLIVIYIL